MGKSKQNLKELRNQKEAEKKAKFRQDNQEREDEKQRMREEEERKLAEIRRLEYLASLKPVRERKLSEVKKSSAKAAGVKSVFVRGNNELLITAFGKGNDAIREKRVTAAGIKSISETENFKMTPEKNLRFFVSGRVNGTTDNPLHVSKEKATIAGCRQDLIHAKALLEKRYFGRSFDDNIHIQLIYQILDIEKILAVHINDIIYTINNLLRYDNQFDDMIDLIGNITIKDLKTEESFKNWLDGENDNNNVHNAFKELVKSPRLSYFNLRVLSDDEKKSEKKSDKKENKTGQGVITLTKFEFYTLLFVLGKERQMLAHGNSEQNIYKDDTYKNYDRIKVLCDRLYKNRVDNLNNGFIEKAEKRNLPILSKALGLKTKEEQKQLLEDYYRFTIYKYYKNMGFSVKTLREHITADIEEAFVIREKKYDPVRGKLYPFIDFVITRFYLSNSKETERLVGVLRASETELAKDRIYANEARFIWSRVKDQIMNGILPELEDAKLQKDDGEEKVQSAFSKADLSAFMISDCDVSIFSKIIYLMTLFMDGKEINILLTALINKFENIASFIKVLKEEGEAVGFTKHYDFFYKEGQEQINSEKVAEQLRIINSFARMSKPDAKAKEIMFVDALKVLGFDDEQTRENEIKALLSPDSKTRNPQKHALRNFIANNVIESARFRYLVRYGNTNRIKGLLSNKELVMFVLNDIPETQILRYYISVTRLERKEYKPEMKDKLAEMLARFSYKDISGVEQNDKRATPEEQEEKRQKQALIRLYLTVLYLIMKNLVNINSRYFLAFHCVERDALLMDDEAGTYKKTLGTDSSAEHFKDYVFIAKGLYERNPQTKKRVNAFIEQNLSNSDAYTVRAFRNKIEHLDAVRNAELYLEEIRGFSSWFELYHYIMQRRILDQFTWDSTHESRKKPGTMIISPEELNPQTLKYFDLIGKYHTMCKDFTKALCVPFVYNLPRFKNLTIDALFDMNRPGAIDENNNRNAADAAEIEQQNELTHT